MEKKTLVTTAAPVNAPILNGVHLSYIAEQDGNHYLVNVNLDTMGMVSKPIEWNRVDGASICETHDGKMYYSDPLKGEVHMIQPNGAGHVVAQYPIEMNDIVTRTLFQRPALLMTGERIGKLTATLLEDRTIREVVLEDNVVLPKGANGYNNIGCFDDVHMFEELNWETGAVTLGYIKNGRFVRIPAKFQGYLPTKGGVLGYKVGDNNMVSHLCLLTEEALLKAVNGDTREVSRQTKLKFNTKSVFGIHGCGIIPHCDLDTGTQYAGMVGEHGTCIMDGTKIVTVAQPMANGVLVTKGEQVVAIDVQQPTAAPVMPATTDVDVDAPAEGEDW